MGVLARLKKLTGCASVGHRDLPFLRVFLAARLAACICDSCSYAVVGLGGPMVLRWIGECEECAIP